MYTIERPERPRLVLSGPEDEQLSALLDWYRATLLIKCAGLDQATLARAPIASSSLTLLGILRHMTGCEEWWFQEQLDGTAPQYSYDPSEDPDVDFNDLDSRDLKSVFERFSAAVIISRANVARHDLTDIIAGKSSDGRVIDVRAVCLHMIEEYARHVGHCDLLRELIDGSTGF